MARKKALVVDDSKLARYVMKKMLMEYGMDVDTVESAEEALGYLSHQRCNIVFMDQMMPGMDGLEAVKAIKEDPETANIPVMMYTSKGGEVFVGQARKLGAYGVMPKQVKPVELYKVLRKLQLISQQKQKVKEDSLVAANAGSERPEPEAPEPISDPILEKALNQNQETIEEIAQVAAESVEQHSFPAQVKRLLNEQTQLLRREFSRHTRKVLESQQGEPKEEAETQTNKKAAFIQETLKMVAAAVIILLPTALFINLTGEDTTGASAAAQNLQLKNQELTNLNQKLQEELDSAVKQQQVMLESIEWAVNKSGAYGFNDMIVDQAKTQVIYELFSRLSSIDFKGQINIDGYLGDYCVINDPQIGIMVADSRLSIQDCKTLKQLDDGGQSFVEKQHFAYKELMSLPFLSDSQGIQVSGTFHGFNNPIIKYPSLAIVDRAGEWNSIAVKNSRIVITINPEADWLQTERELISLTE